MKRLTFINLEQIVSSYMVVFKTKSVSYSDICKWSQHIESSLSNTDHKIVALYGNRYAEEIKRKSADMFVVGESAISLVDCRGKKDLGEHILSYIDGDILFGMFSASKNYKRSAKVNEERCLF